MESPNQAATRYPDADLAEFKVVVEKKLATVYEELEYLKEQISDTTENMEKDSDYMEDSTSYSDLEMFQNMLHRQQKHAQNLENALLRIKNKSYGICSVTGKLIDKRRLMAVPTTSMTLDAKMAGKPAVPEQKNVRLMELEPDEDMPKIVSRQSSPKPAKKALLKDDLDIFEDSNDDMGADMDFDMGGNMDGDMDDMDE